MTEIDWNKAMKKESSTMKLSSSEMEVEHIVHFVEVFNITKEGKVSVGANVVCDSLEGDTLWLSGDYGPTNGLLSLIKAANDDPNNIEGNTFIYTKTASEKSPAGFAHRWQAA